MVDFYGDVDPAVEMWNTLFTDVVSKHATIKKTRIKSPGKRGHIVADTLLPTQMFPRLPARVCAAQETSWATMCDRDFLHAKAIKTNSKYHWDMLKRCRALSTKK